MPTLMLIDGTALAYNRPDPWLPDIVVCHPGLAARLRGLLTWAGVAAATHGEVSPWR